MTITLHPRGPFSLAAAATCIEGSMRLGRSLPRSTDSLPEHPRPGRRGGHEPSAGRQDEHLDAYHSGHYDDQMRTTLTLDDDVARLIEEQVHRTRTSVKQVVNDAIRAALAPKPVRSAPYRATVHHAELAPGLDLAGFNKLADELEDEAIIRLAQQ